MPYCYACRNRKPATHGHFTDYGALALRPPKRHITAIEAQWRHLSDAERNQARDAGRVILAHADADADQLDGTSSTERRAGTSSTGPARRSGAARTDTRAGSRTSSTPSPRRERDADQLDGAPPPLPAWAYALAGVGAVLWLVVSVKRGRPSWPASPSSPSSWPGA